MTAAIETTEPVIQNALAILRVPEQFRDLVDSFVQRAEEEGADWVATADECNTCGVWLADGTDLPCLAVAEDEDGNFACVDTAGRLHNFTIEEVQ